MSIGAGIPAALEAMDRLEDEQDRHKVSACLRKLLDIMKRLDNWRLAYTTTLRTVYGFDMVEPPAAEDIWYPDITVANSLTHYWAFWVICAVYALRLGSELSCLGLSRDEYPRQQRIITTKVNLILKSVKYLTSDDLKLFGPTSLCLPAKVAYEYVQQTGDAESTALCNNAIRHIGNRGYFYLNAFIQADIVVLRPIPRMRPQSAKLDSEKNNLAGFPLANISDPVDV
jgi:hypothetical protein